MNRTALCALMAASLNATACGLHRPNLPWRTIDDPGTQQSANPDREDCRDESTGPGVLDSLANKNTQTRTRCTSHEVYSETETHPEFDLHIVEFDDQGLFWNRQEVERSLRQIREVSEKQDVLVIVFFHGWFNNADVCNGKLACFRELVALAAQAEKRFVEPQRKQVIETRTDQARASQPRRVIGVFGGWRGETLAVPGLKFVTFWGRKSAAHTVGENGAATELIARLSRIVRRQADAGNDTPSGNGGAKSQTPVDGRGLTGSSLVVIGHSFGGALVMSAVNNELSRAAGEALAEDGSEKLVRSRLADLTVLINPAVEASRFDSVRRAAATATFRPEQLPILLTLSSEADRPNQMLFPIGQSVAFSQKAARSREQWQSMIQSLGTFRAYQTHRLIALDTGFPHYRKVDCQCDSGIRDYGGLLLNDLDDLYQELRELHDGLRAGQKRDINADAFDHGRRQAFKYSRLEPMQDVDPNSPFMMVRVDDDVINGHSDIFNHRIVDFVIRTFVLAELKRLVVESGVRLEHPSPPATDPPVPQPGLPACFVVQRSPEGVVSTVKADRSVLPERGLTTTVRIDRLDGERPADRLSLERQIDDTEREFPFTFSRPTTYWLTASGPSGLRCNALEMTVGRPQERTRLFGAYGVVGLADGIGAQFGGSFWVKRLGVQSSVIFPAATDRDPTYDVELGYRGNRGIGGVGYRRRRGTEIDEAEKIGYVHYTLELPGLRLLGNTWSTWLGLEFSPIATMTGSDAWTGQFDFSLRLQIRLPRERWFNR
jgi:hypothetical protein